MYDFYYKQIKECLRFLKEVYKEYEVIPSTSKEMLKGVH